MNVCKRGGGALPRFPGIFQIVSFQKDFVCFKCSFFDKDSLLGLYLEVDFKGVVEVLEVKRMT